MITPWKVTRVDAALLTVAGPSPANLLIALLTPAVLTLAPFASVNVAGMAAVRGLIEEVTRAGVTVTLPRS